MTWRSHTSFKRSLLTVLFVTSLHAGPVSGRVELRDSKDSTVRKKADYSGVVVWLEPINAPAPGAKYRRPAVMDQRDKTFVPHVLAIEIGTPVNFPNSDPIFHNAFSNYNGQFFDLGLYPPGASRTVRFSRPGVVRVFCNIHASMSAVIAVLPTPYYAVTRKDGTYRIPDVPPGPYTLHVFHERSTQSELDKQTRMVGVDDNPLVVGPMMISESGYLAIPHSNKFGHEYHDPADNRGMYPAGPQ